MWLVILFPLIVAYITYYCCFRPYNYWKHRGITYEIPLPLVGNFGDIVFKRKHASQLYDYLYKKYSSDRYVGIYVFMKPALLVRDLDLIKKICVEEFEHFTDRIRIFDKTYDDILGNNLNSLKGNHWKETRSVLNNLFCYSEIGNYFTLISDCAKTFTNYFVKEDKNLFEIQLSDVFSRYDCDVISRICFGKTINSLQDKDNDYFNAYRNLKRFGISERLRLSLIQLCPHLAKILQIKVLSTSKTDFFKKLLLEALHNSNSEYDKRGHFLNASLETKNQRNKIKHEKSVEFLDDVAEVECHVNTPKRQWRDEELIPQALMFINSHIGYEAVLSASSFIAYELALNPAVQVKLQEEIDNVSSEANVTYETISRMKYLDCVILESLRKWPPLYQIERECVKNFFEVDLSIPDDEKIVIEKNTAIIIPIMAIHRDPQYFPQPEKFSPERFDDENKGDILPGSYMPFGTGPRKCIGSNIALLEIKLLFFHLLSKFDIVPTGNTKTRVEWSPSHSDVNAANTFLGLKPRKVTSL